MTIIVFSDQNRVGKDKRDVCIPEQIITLVGLSPGVYLYPSDFSPGVKRAVKMAASLDADRLDTLMVGG